MRTVPKNRLWAGLSALVLALACQPGGGTEDTNDLQVSGRLLEWNGEPAADAWVILYPFSETAAGIDSMTTDRNGCFKFRNVKKGRYSLQGRLTSRDALVFLPSLEVEGDSGLHLTPLTLEPAAFVQGRIEGTGMQARALLDGTPYRSDVDASGRFSFPSLAAGEYVLRIFVTSEPGPPSLEKEAAQLRIKVRAGDSLTLAPISVQLTLQWSHRSRIEVDSADPGGGPVKDFPLLLRLEGDEFPAAAEGQDICFSMPDGSPLAYEIESWDPATRKAAIWVRLDSLARGTSLWMFWGNSNAPSLAGKAFDSATYAGVWHLGQGPAGSAPQMMDASGRLNHARVEGSTAPATVQGIAGAGVQFDGSDGYLSTASQQNHPDDFTLSLWFRAETFGGKLAGLESSITGLSKYFDRQLWLDSAGRVCFGVYSPAPAVVTPADSPFVMTSPGSPSDPPRQLNMQRILASPPVYLDKAWHHVAATLSPMGQFLYVDGTQAAANPACTVGAGFTGYWRMGGGNLKTWQGAPSREYFHGSLDEISVARSRSADWIRLAYLTQRPGSRTLRLTAEY